MPQSTMTRYVNISAYKFVDLDDLPTRRETLLELCQSLRLKGTILLSQEGINLFVAGTRESIDRLVAYFEATEEYRGLPYKESLSDDQPFTRMLVRIKKEIITFGVPGIRPHERTSPKLPAAELKQWLDEGKDLVLLDVRNDYEVELGTFSGATHLNIDHFREFPQAVDRLPSEARKKPVVMFCTGGIRCEKAGPFLEQAGFSEVYQLDGGILKYFETCGSAHYQGECFVFDKRVAVDPSLEETDTQQCYRCQHPLTVDDQKSAQYVPGQSCPYCYRSPEEKMRERLMVRQAALDESLRDMPGRQPYFNQRPVHVPARFDKATALEFLSQFHPHVERERWQREFDSGMVHYKDQPIAASAVVRSGMKLVHLQPGTTEPDVATAIRLLYEDDDLIVVDKPAPLPMHPSGRFNRNTLVWMLRRVYPAQKLRIVHRLDANTSGVVALCRKQRAAQILSNQFSKGQVAKRYLARVHGHPANDRFVLDEAIANRPDIAGLRLPDEEGLPAETRISVMARFDDGTSLVECRPITGRTNQIRLHLWHAGHPIVGDPSYQVDGQVSEKQSLDVDDPPMMLRAVYLEFRHPTTGENVSFQCPAPNWAK